jgi:hypothetical protein
LKKQTGGSQKLHVTNHAFLVQSIWFQKRLFPQIKMRATRAKCIDYIGSKLCSTEWIRRPTQPEKMSKKSASGPDPDLVKRVLRMLYLA